MVLAPSLAIESLFRLELSPEEFAARYAHDFAMFSFHEYRYRRPGMTEWVQEPAKIFFDQDLPMRLRQLREKYLTPEEIERVEAIERGPF
jgi:hypothetical protein